MNLLVILGAWFAAGLVTTLLLGPRLRRAAEAAGTALEQEPVFPAGRSPFRWRVGTLGVVGLLAGSTGMAAAGALPGSAQTIAHNVLGSVGVHVPEESAPEVVAAPATPPWGDVGGAGAPSTTSELDVDRTPSAPEPPAGGDRAALAEGSEPTGDAGAATGPADGLDSGTGSDSTGSGGADAGPPASTAPSTEPSDAPPDGTDEPSDVPADPPAEEPPPTTTVPPPPEPPADPDDTPTSTPSTTTTTTTAPPPDAPPPDAPPPQG